MSGTNIEGTLDKSARTTEWQPWPTERTITKSKPASGALNPTQLRKRLLSRCCLLSLVIIAISLDFYRHGLRLETVGVFSSTYLLIFALPFCFVRSLFTSIDVIRGIILKKHTKKNLLLLPIFPSAVLGPHMLPLPTFTDGAAHTLRQLDISDQLVAATAEELAKPRDRYDDWGLRSERCLEISKKDPFSKLNLSGPHLRILGSSLLFDFGSPIAFRWGISISGVKGKPPAIPRYGTDPKVVSAEIIVYTDTSD